MYLFEGTDYGNDRSQKDDDALAQIRSAAGVEMSIADKVPPFLVLDRAIIKLTIYRQPKREKSADDGAPKAPRKPKEPKPQVSEEERRLNRWKQHGYTSRAITLTAEDKELLENDEIVDVQGIALSDRSVVDVDAFLEEFVHTLNGDASKPKVGDGEHAFVILYQQHHHH